MFSQKTFYVRIYKLICFELKFAIGIEKKSILIHEILKNAWQGGTWNFSGSKIAKISQTYKSLIISMGIIILKRYL